MNYSGKNLIKSTKGKKPKHPLLAAIEDNIGYIPLILYSFSFTLLSYKPDVMNLFCLFFALISAFFLLIETFGKRKYKRSKSWSLLIALIITIILLIINSKLNLVVLSGIVSNILSGIVLTISLFVAFISSVEDSKKHYCEQNDDTGNEEV